MRSALSVVAALGVCVGSALAGCGKDSTAPSDPSILAESDVNVGSNGGAGHVYFTVDSIGTSGLEVRITLKATSTSVVGVIATMQPYGYLVSPSGAEGYTPPLETAQNGQNTADLTLTELGRYELTVFDGSGAGGTVHVKVQKVT
jgi:hypothetical protein